MYVNIRDQFVCCNSMLSFVSKFFHAYITHMEMSMCVHVCVCVCDVSLPTAMQ